MSYYDDLSVPEVATADEIKRAYFRRIRLHPPESDPLGFQRIQTAYKTLSDPSERQSYDARLKHGGRLATLEKEAAELFEEKDWLAAENRLKEIILLDPEDDSSRNLLALCLAYQERYKEAVKLFEQTIRRNPNTTIYHLNLGQCWFQRAMEGNADRGCLEKALNSFKRVTDLEPFHSDGWLMQARVELQLESHGQAWQSAEKAVQADGKEDIGDLEAFFFMIELAVLSGQSHKVPAVTKRIAQVTCENHDAKEYSIARLIVLSQQLIQIKAFPAALKLQEAAAFLAPHNAKVRESVKFLQVIVGSIDEFADFGDDEAIPQILRLAVQIWLADAFGEKIDAELRRQVQTALPIWASNNSGACRDAISYIYRNYPSISAQVAPPLNTMFDSVNLQETLMRSSGSNRMRSSGSNREVGCGLLLLLGLVLLLFVSLATYPATWTGA